MDWTERDGIALRYDLREGRGGPLLVLVHEMGGTLESWDDVLPLLDPDVPVLRYDTRGAGLSTKVRAPLAIGDLAEDIDILLDGVGWRGAVVLSGIAVGGAVALHYGARNPGRVAGLLPFGPATGIGSNRRAATLARAETVERDGMAAIADAALAMSYPEALRSDAERFRRLRARWLSNDPGSYAAILRMLASLDMAQDLAAIACPTLVLAGEHDLVRPPDTVRAVAEAIPHASFETLATGHFAPVQAPGPFAARLNRFVVEIGSPA